ncbi:MAG: ABC-F family ATP-binding cassette domain-containing protein [Pirellulales bacterium]|nr:ABC-F family ATP-binding cassette domain-containing protein [Pirellulales bacterium]
MIVLSVEGVRKHFGPEAVLDGVTFNIHPGDRIGLVGPNGAGKTTLMRIIAGREDADGGTAAIHPSARVGYLEQQPTFQPGRTVWDEAHSALDELVAMQHEAIEVAHALAETRDDAEHRRLAARFDHLQQELHRHDAYNLDHKIERVLEGLGFRPAAFQLGVDSLSGGEQNRLMLAKLLLSEPDLMLLDEPSNHLDIEATEWLEEFLAASSAAMLLVSHDRYFLDKVTNRTLELFRGTTDSYTGNFSAYWRQKAERLLVQQRTYEKQQIEIAKTEDFIRRNAYGQKHAQAEDRRKKLERIERVDPPREISAPVMGFPEAERSGDIVLRAEGLKRSYDRVLFENVEFDIQRGERWALLGPNGSGKTTLLRCLMGLMSPDAGQVSLGQGVVVGYFDQQLGSLSDDMDVVDAVRPSHKEFVLQRRRDLLARFGLVGDTALQTVGSLSGGERCRAALARLAARDANFLVLDEPTNHLDLWARDSLERSLREFNGTVLFVSHDRYFVNRVADHLLVIEPRRVRAVEGNYDVWLRLVRDREAAAQESSRKEAKDSKPSKPSPAAGSDGKPPRKRKFPYRKVPDIEKDIFEIEARIEELHAALAQPDTHRDGDLVRGIMAQIESEKATLRTLYEHWEEASEMN